MLEPCLLQPCFHVAGKGKPLTNLRGGYLKSLLSDGSYEGFLKMMLEYSADDAAVPAATPGGEAVI